MTTTSKVLAKKLVALPTKEKLSILDTLISSLDQPDSKIDNLWKKEVESRITAHKAGKIKTVSIQHALSKYRKVKAA